MKKLSSSVVLVLASFLCSASGYASGKASSFVDYLWSSESEPTKTETAEAIGQPQEPKRPERSEWPEWKNQVIHAWFESVGNKIDRSEAIDVAATLPDALDRFDELARCPTKAVAQAEIRQAASRIAAGDNSGLNFDALARGKNCLNADKNIGVIAVSLVNVEADRKDRIAGAVQIARIVRQHRDEIQSPTVASSPSSPSSPTTPGTSTPVATPSSNETVTASASASETEEELNPDASALWY